MLEYQDFNSYKRDYHDIRLWYNFSYPPHMHDSLEFIFLLDGQIYLTVEGKKEEMNAGQMALIFPNQIHSFINIKNATAYVHVFSPDVVEQFTRFVGSRSGVGSVFEGDQDKSHYILACIKKMTEGIDRHNSKEGSYSITVYNGSNISRQTLTNISYLYAVCEQYLQKIPLTNKSLLDNNIAHKIITYVSEHFTDNITLKAISDELGYEQHYLSRCFSKMLGINFRQFINVYRINYAKHLLSDPQKNITDIAMQCGFQSIRNFNRSFKKAEGKTPKEYRNCSIIC